MVVQNSRPWSFKKYAIAGVIGVSAVVGVLLALVYSTPFPKTIQDSVPGASSNPTPEGPTAGAGQDKPGPNDAGGTSNTNEAGGASDTNPKPIPSPIVAAAIEVTPSTISVGTNPLGSKSVSMNIGGDGFHPNQNLKVTLDKSTSLQTDPSPLTSNGNGGFSADKILIPTNTAKGSHTITVIDQSGKSAVANFVVQ